MCEKHWAPFYDQIRYDRAVRVARRDKWRVDNPEKQRELGRRDRATRRARELGQFVEYVDPTVVWDRDAGICHICKEAADMDDWHLEHVVALARGGEHSYANTAVSHPSCNLRKGAK